MKLSSRNLMPRLRSLCQWLELRAAGRVRQLSICVVGRQHGGDGLEQAKEAKTMLAAALRKCGEDDVLSDLQLSIRWPLKLPLSLTRLEFGKCPRGNSLPKRVGGCELLKCITAAVLACGYGGILTSPLLLPAAGEHPHQPAAADPVRPQI